MTPRDRAKHLFDKIPGAVAQTLAVGLIEQAIIAALEEDRASRECCKAEREAILKIAIDIHDDYRASSWPAVAATAVMKVINAIRARPTTDAADTEGEKE